MTIRRKLYFGFGAILAIMLALFVVNMFTVVREHAARSAAAATLSDVEIIENIRFQMMENRLFLENYLLSGDLRDEEKTNKGISNTSRASERRRGQRERLQSSDRLSRRWRRTNTTGPRISPSR